MRNNKSSLPGLRFNGSSITPNMEHDCLHTSNTYIKRYSKKHTQIVARNAEESFHCSHLIEVQSIHMQLQHVFQHRSIQVHLITERAGLPSSAMTTEQPRHHLQTPSVPQFQVQSRIPQLLANISCHCCNLWSLPFAQLNPFLSVQLPNHFLHLFHVDLVCIST